MPLETNKGLLVIQQQLKELDLILRDTLDTLNTVAGMERVAKWRVRTIALLNDTVGPETGREFSKVQPGPSFTNDLVEEFTEFIDTFKIPLTALSKRVAASPSTPPGGG